MFEGFVTCDVDGLAGKLHTLRGGAGAPLLLAQALEFFKS